MTSFKADSDRGGGRGDEHHARQGSVLDTSLERDGTSGAVQSGQERSARGGGKKVGQAGAGSAEAAVCLDAVKGRGMLWINTDSDSALPRHSFLCGGAAGRRWGWGAALL